MKFPRHTLVLCVVAFAFCRGVSAQVSVTTWQADNAHTGNNSQETILTPGTVSSPGNFGLVFSHPLDGQTYGQPLVAAGVNINGTTHNVLYVATQRCKLYAFDGDNVTGANANALWQDTLLPAGTVPVPQSVVGSSDIYDTLGITTTPVIDSGSGTIYIVSKVQRTSDNSYHQYLYAIDLATGAYKFNSPVEINPIFSGTSSDAVNNVIPFSALHAHLRCAMALNNGLLYLAYASHSDTTPYHGEVLSYNATTLQYVKGFNAAPLGYLNGIWNSGAGPAIDSAGNVFVATGNGNWGDPKKSSTTTFPDASYPYGTNWAHSILKLPPDTFNVKVSQTMNWFTPNYWDDLNNGDLDLGCGGITLLPDLTGPHQHILVEGGKGGIMYVIDRDNMGGGGTNGPENSIQEIHELNGKAFFCTPAYYNGSIYYSPSGGPLTQRAVGYNAVDGSYIQANNPTLSTEIYSNNKGSGCFISSNGTSNGIVWILKGNGMRAYNATNVSSAPIYTANAQVPGDNYTYQTAKFTLPMVANGKVYYTGFNTDTFAGQLFVYGILPSATGAPAAASDATAVANASDTITLNWTDNSTNESGFRVLRSTNATSGFTQVNLTGANITAFTDTGLNPATTYYYQIVATNSAGDARASNVASATTFPAYAETGLVAYWNLDQTNGTTLPDGTGNGHTGTLHGETTSGAAGFVNLAVNFHGTGQSASDIVVANKADLQYTVTGSFTWAGWVQADALRGSPELGANAVEETIFAKSRESGNYYGLWINTSDKWVFRGPAGEVLGPTVVQGVWTHVAVVQDGINNTRKLYVNGALAGSGPAQAADGAGALYMARQNVTGNIEGFPGSLDEIRFYSRALAQTELSKLMGPPVLGGLSIQTHGNSGSFTKTIWPLTSNKAIESRKGTMAGSYKVALSFAAPVASGITASLQTQGGGTATGSVQSVSYDSTGKIVTVALTGVGNLQALNVHLIGVTPLGSTPVVNGTADIPLNILWGDVNGDNVVNNLDYSLVTNTHATLITSANFATDINCDGKIDAADDALVNAALGTNLGAQTETNLSIFQDATALSVNSGSGNVASNAFDNSLSSRWESTQKVDPQWIYVDLKSVCTVHSILLYWENAGGKDYLIQVSTTDTSDGAWSTIKTVTGNTVTSAYLTYSGFNAQARYVRIYGTIRTSGTGTNGYGYSINDCQVIGLSGVTAAPVINSATAATATVNTAFSYQIMATNSPASYSATNLPPGLSVDPATGIISGTPTQAGSFIATIGATNSINSGTASLVFTVQAPFVGWQNLYFTATDLSNPAISGPNATPAGDGITNLLKYALNLNPKTSGVGGLPTVSTTTISGLKYLTLTYTKVLSATDIAYAPEVSGDILTWSSGISNLTTVSTADNPDGKTQTVVVRDNTATSGAAKRFIRLKVTQP